MTKTPVQNRKTIKLAPTNFPGKALVSNIDGVDEHYLTIGDVNDDFALTIFVEDNQIRNAN